jgi:two-component system NarL family sensor kinase
MVSAVSPEEFEVYFRLLWLFVFIMLGLSGFLFYIYLAVRRAREREAQSLAFSWMVVAGQEAERRRISCELHDTVLPEIRRFSRTDGGAADAEYITRQQEMVSERIREICTELMPPDFARLSLRDSLMELCVRFARRTGLPCIPSLEEDLDFSGIRAENQLHLYRMVQEAFTNIEKHARARRVVLTVRRDTRTTPGGFSREGARQAPSILICVSDDGEGLPSGGIPPSSAGLGVRSMRERAAVLGARLDFISESGNGLMVRIEVPAPDPQNPEVF